MGAVVPPSSDFMKIGKQPCPPWSRAIDSQPLPTAAGMFAAASPPASSLIQRVRVGL